MEKKIIINRVDLGQRVTGYELMNVSANGKEIVGYTPKQMMDAVKAGEVMGMVLNAAGELEMDKAKGFNAIMVSCVCCQAHRRNLSKGRLLHRGR